ncbi:MAG: hypothetical protein ACRDYX_00580 [Egibacteraceae bacterium]
MTPGPDGHRYFEELAVTHVVGGLDDSEGQIFRAHLLECGECRAQVGELRSIAHDLADVERNERRVRAAKAVETKRREAAEEDLAVDEVPGSSRASRIAVVVGLVIVIVLSAWNFTLRGRVAELVEANGRAVQASGVLEFGQKWDVVGQDGGLQGTVKRLGDSLAILVVKAQTDRIYGVYIQTDKGVIAWRRGVKPPDGRFLIVPDGPRKDAVRVLITDPGPDTVPGEVPSGRVVFEAKAPVSSV